MKMWGKKRWAITAAVVLGATSLAAPVAFAQKLTSSAPVPPFQLNQQWNPAWSYNPFTPDFQSLLFLADVPLAYRLRPLGKYYPVLASSWKISQTGMTIHLRGGARWQNGSPVTSTDVKDTLLLAGLFTWGMWPGIQNITTPSASQVDITFKKGVSEANESKAILTLCLVPSAEYGKFVGPQLLQDILTNNTKAIQAAQKAVLAFNPKTYIGDGPFQLVAMTTNQADLKKSPTFYGAAGIHVPEIYVYNIQSTSAGWADMSSGRTDFSWNGAPKNIQDMWLSNPQHHLSLPWDFSQKSFVFNDRRYPFNLVGVRQAMAYVINRPLVTAVASGFMLDSPNTVITGLQDAVLQQWIPASALKGFNTYPYFPAKGARILEGLHFKKTAAGWIMPNGKAFTVSITTPAGWSGPQLSAELVANELNQFGIKTTATAVEQPGYWTNLSKGQFQVAWNFQDGWYLNPVNEFYSELVQQSYNPTAPGMPGIGFGPTGVVPGLGKVNFYKSLSAAQTMTSPAVKRKLALDYAKFINEQLPFLPYANKRLQVWYSSTNYIDWPSAHSNIWQQMGGNADQALTYMMMEGYLRPR